MESGRPGGFSGGQAGESVFRPWRSEASYKVLLAAVAVILVFVWYAESHPILESQIALGCDPDEVLQFVLVGLAGVTLLLTFSVLRARRSLLATGELRLTDSTLIVAAGSSSPVSREMSELRRIRCPPSGAPVRLEFSDGTITLPGQWLPPGWKRTWKGWSSPAGAVKLSQKTHPLLAALNEQRPDLPRKVLGLGTGLARLVGAELLLGLLFAFFVNVGSYPLYRDSRRVGARQRAYDAAQKAFQEGRYLEVCESYRRALPDLYLYGSVHAAECLLYCGDRKSALRAAVGYNLQPLWPVAMDPDVLARIRIASGRYGQAEELLCGYPGLLLYEALAELGMRSEAERTLNGLAPKNAMANVLVLRHGGRQREAQEAAEVLCAASRKWVPWSPPMLVAGFERCLLARGVRGLGEDPRFAPARKTLPEVRSELIRFAGREAPELQAELRSLWPETRREP